MRHFNNTDVFEKTEHICHKIEDVVFAIPIFNEIPDMTKVCCFEGVANDVWDLIGFGISFEEIIERLTNIYDAESSFIINDIDAFLSGLLNNGMIRVEKND